MTYRPVKNEDWPIHTDGDLLTMILNISKNFDGTNLRIYTNNSNDEEYYDYKHEAGKMIIVPGNVRHSVTQLNSGQRMSLVIKVNEKGKNF
jgi:hypothetical protein